MMRILILVMVAAGLFGVEYNLKKGVMAKGYDVVAYTTGVAVKGDPSHKVEHENVTYHFSTAANREAFLANPAGFIPAYGGWCAYAVADGDMVDVDPKTFKIIEGRVYLFYNGFWGNTLKKWNKDEQALKVRADRFWQQQIESEKATSGE